MKWVLSAVMLLVLSPAMAHTGPLPQGGVVSYLVSPAGDSTDWSPDEPGYMARIPLREWDWRIFDPVTKRDTLFLKLPYFPLLLRWDPTFTSVEFLLGSRIARVPWTMRPQVTALEKLPMDSTICDFWRDPSGRYHVVTQNETEVATQEGRTVMMTVARRWDRDFSGWRVAVVDSPGGGHYGECFISPHLEEGAPRVSMVPVSSLLDSMRIGYHADSAYAVGNPENGDAWSWVRSDIDSLIGLEMRTGFGDTNHAMEPFTWVDRRRGLRKLIYVEGQSGDQVGGQLAFLERDGFLLVNAEFSGGHPSVVDMRSGETLLVVARPSARAVWVPAPEGWGR